MSNSDRGKILFSFFASLLSGTIQLFLFTFTEILNILIFTDFLRDFAEKKIAYLGGISHSESFRDCVLGWYFTILGLFCPSFPIFGKFRGLKFLENFELYTEIAYSDGISQPITVTSRYRVAAES